MRSKAIYPFVILPVLGLLIMTSCEKEPNGLVSGVVTVYDPSTPEVKTPLEGIKLYLINSDFRIDSIDYANNAGAIIDSAYTGSNGKYLIDGLPNGNYAIVPVPDSIMYHFELDNGSDSVKFLITEESFDHTIDFKTAMPDSAAGYQIRLSIINRPYGGEVFLYRPVFLFNIIPSYNSVRIDNLLGSDADDMTLDLQFGIFGFLYVVSNNIRITAFDKFGNYLFTRWISNSYFNTPSVAHWQLDWTAQTITRIE